MKIKELFEKEKSLNQLSSKDIKLVKSIYSNPAFEYENSFNLLKASFEKHKHARNS
jgi:hypothetical protein